MNSSEFFQRQRIHSSSPQLPARSMYGSLEMEDRGTSPSPSSPIGFDDNMRRWSVMEKLDRRYYCRNRSCRECMRNVNTKCLLATLMLVIFVALGIFFTRAVFFSVDLSPLHFDFIIVGAGPAGCIVARRLADEGASVLLLEAGSSATHYTLGGRDMFGALLSRFDIPLMWSTLSDRRDLINNAAYNWGDFRTVNTKEIRGDSKESIGLKYSKASAPISVLLGKGLGGSEVQGAMLDVDPLESDIVDWDMGERSDWLPSKIFRVLNAVREASGWLPDSNTVDAETVDADIEATAPDSLGALFTRAAMKAGLPYLSVFSRSSNVTGRVGVGFYPQSVLQGQRNSAAKAMLGQYLQQVGKDRSNIQVETGAIVTKVLLQRRHRQIKTGQRSSHDNDDLANDDDNVDTTRSHHHYNAVGVEYIQNGETKRAYLGQKNTPASSATSSSRSHTFEEVRAVMLTAGALNTPKLLMNSGIGSKHLLKKAGVEMKVHHPHVGAHLRNHISVGVTAQIGPLLSEVLPNAAAFPQHWSKYVRAIEGYQQEQTLNSGLRSKENKERKGTKNSDSLNITRSNITVRPVLDQYGILGSTGVSAGIFLASPYSTDRSLPDIQVTVYSSANDPHYLQRTVGCDGGESTDTSMRSENEVLFMVTLLRPQSQQQLILDRSDPLFSNPIIAPMLNTDTEEGSFVQASAPCSIAHLLHQSDVRVLAWGVDRLRQLLHAPELAGYVGNETSPGEEAPAINNAHNISDPEYLSTDEMIHWVKMNAFFISHWVGSVSMGRGNERDQMTRMLQTISDELVGNETTRTHAGRRKIRRSMVPVKAGEEDEESEHSGRANLVVDQKLRVRRVDQLRIADASVIPVIPRGNPIPLVKAVAWIAADLVLAGRKL